MDALGIAVFLALTGWVLAGLAAWAATEWRTEVDRQRRARDRADYAAHKAEQRITDLQAKCDALLMRMGRKQGAADDLAEAALGVAMLGRLDALHSPGPAAPVAGLQPDSLGS